MRRHINNKPSFVIKKADKELSKHVRKLQAKVYLHHGNIGPDQINEHGFLNEKTDPYFKHSVYFAAEQKGELVAGGRLIEIVKSYKDLQISKEVNLSKANKDVYRAAKSGKVCEMSGLVKKKGKSRVLPLLLIKEMFHYSKAKNYEYILMDITKQPYKRFKKIFGEAIIELGEPYKIQHGNNLVYPCCIHVTNSHLYISRIHKNDPYDIKLIKKLLVS